jgi:LysM repeat protein
LIKEKKMRQIDIFKSSVGIILATFGLISCDTSGLDLDLRNNNYDTSRAAQAVLEKRPKPDNRGIISYPNYQVAIARLGDSLQTMAARIGLDSKALAQYNGVTENEQLRSGEVIALPARIAEYNNQGQSSQKAKSVDVTEIAQSALDEPSVKKTSTFPSQKPQSLEPIRHKVKRGETAFTISRLYNVTIRSLAEWNALDSDFTIREGQHLLVPLANRAPPVKQKATEAAKPGLESVTPSPPSAKKPLPKEEKPAVVESKTKAEPTIVEMPSGGILAYPVKGKIIRAYVKNKNDGIDFSAPVGSPVLAAESGTVAAITSDANKVPIVVIKHKNNLLTVYANINEISVQKGSVVARGEAIGKVGRGDPSYLHFEVRKGFESVDPKDYLK